MNEKTIDKVVRKARRNCSFGCAVIFEGRCIQAFPEEGGTFAIVSGCYSETDGVPEFDAMSKAGTLKKQTTDMGGGLVKVTAEMSEAQLRKYIALADEVDCEA